MRGVISDVVRLPDGTYLRPVAPTDVEALADAYRRNRAHLRRWEPSRAESYFTADGQLVRFQAQSRLRDERRLMAWVLADGDRIVGAVTLSQVTFGAFRSASLGYWVDVDRTGAGLATSAVAEVCRLARHRLGLHRLEASTMLENEPSARVLGKCGFEPIGVAPRYLWIDDAWRDHRLYQRVLHDEPPSDW